MHFFIEIDESCVTNQSKNNRRNFSFHSLQWANYNPDPGQYTFLYGTQFEDRLDFGVQLFTLDGGYDLFVPVFTFKTSHYFVVCIYLILSSGCEQETVKACVLSEKQDITPGLVTKSLTNASAVFHQEQLL